MTVDRREIAVRVSGLQKTFRIGFFRKRVEAVKDSTFDVHRGEIFGLVGPNGAGKTTTIRMLMGLITPDVGSATIFDVPISETRARKRVGFLPETPNFYDSLKPVELLHYYGSLYGVERRVRVKRIPELLELVGLADAVDKPLRKFSKGMLQRIGLAQALLPDSELVILDEPQSGLDPFGRKDVRDIIVSLRERGKTVMFSSHILPDVEQICDRIAIIHEGTVRKSGRLSELLEGAGRSVEVILRTDDDWEDRVSFGDEVGASRTTPEGARIYQLPNHDVAQRVIRVAVEHGASVVSVQPLRAQLEEVFMIETGHAPAEASL